MAFRDDLEAARSRVDALERELAGVRQERDAALADVTRLEAELVEARRVRATATSEAEAAAAGTEKPKLSKKAERKQRAEGEEARRREAAAKTPKPPAREGRWKDLKDTLIATAVVVGIVGLSTAFGLRSSCAQKRAIAARRPPDGVHIDRVIEWTWALRHFLVPGEAQVVRVDAEMVTIDGRMHLGLGGALHVELVGSLPTLERPADLPLGAPVPRDPRRCTAQVSFSKDRVYLSRNMGCRSDGGPRPRCPVPQLLGRVIAAGGPEKALYGVTYDPPEGNGRDAEPRPWYVDLHDGTKRIFADHFDDECGAAP